MRAALATHGFDPDQTLDYTNSFIAKYPSNERGHFLKAYAEWKKGSKDAAIEELNQAIDHAPTHLRLAEILTEIKKPNASREAFPLDFKFGVGFEDFREEGPEPKHAIDF